MTFFVAKLIDRWNVQLTCSSSSSFGTEPPHSLRTPLCTLRSVVSLFPVCQCFDHADIGTLIEEGLPGDNIVQIGIQIQCLFVPGSDMQRDFGIVVLACLLLRTLQ
jgi:hypothetical protein